MNVAFPEFVEPNVVDEVDIANDVTIKADIVAAEIVDHAVIFAQDALAGDDLKVVLDNEVIVVIAIVAIDEAVLSAFALEQAALTIDVLN